MTTADLPAPLGVVLQWAPSTLFGWGVYGFNLALAWAMDGEVVPVFSLPVESEHLMLDRLREGVLAACWKNSAALQEKLKPMHGNLVKLQTPVLHCLSGAFTADIVSTHNVLLSGTPNIGLTFFEHTRLDAAALRRAREFDVVVTGSSWNAALLREQGLSAVATVLQGVDRTLFHPAPAAGFYKDRFMIFSGGKLEYRKGQDIVLAAFRIFAQRHAEAVLVTAWHSPWPGLARSLSASPHTAEVPFTDQDRIDVKGWAAASGVARDRIIDLGLIVNPMMPPVLREMDVAVFANRAEGGTNLVAMECMACGIPVILSRNTGHLDLIRPGTCYTLDRQAEVGGSGAPVGAVPGWGESDVEETVERLEEVWRNRREALSRGTRAAEAMGGMTWADSARGLKAVIKQYV